MGMACQELALGSHVPKGQKRAATASRRDGDGADLPCVVQPAALPDGII